MLFKDFNPKCTNHIVSQQFLTDTVEIKGSNSMFQIIRKHIINNIPKSIPYQLQTRYCDNSLATWTKRQGGQFAEETKSFLVCQVLK